jgi:hypothetical protein
MGKVCIEIVFPESQDFLAQVTEVEDARRES